MLILAAIAMQAYPSWHRSKLIRRCEAQKFRRIVLIVSLGSLVSHAEFDFVTYAVLIA